MLTKVIFIFLIGAVAASVFQLKKKPTLVLSHVLFRHGDRTPLNDAFIDHQPFNDGDFYPYGLGQLNLKGKKRAYNLGTALRKRYKRFLGNIYSNDLIEAVCSDYERTQMSLQLVLAALFKPNKQWKIKGNLNWQPITFRYINAKEDNLLAVYKTCPQAISSNTENLDPTSLALFAYLSKHSGMKVQNSVKAMILHNQLLVQLENGISIPEWAKPVWPEPLTAAGRQGWADIAKEHTSTLSGHLLKKILDDSMNKTNGTGNGKKLYLYSGHDFNIVGLLSAIGNYKNNNIRYGAYVLLELHKIGKVYGFKIYLQNYETYRPELLHVENCGTFCPMDRFAKLVRKVYKGDNYCK